MWANSRNFLANFIFFPKKKKCWYEQKMLVTENDLWPDTKTFEKKKRNLCKIFHMKKISGRTNKILAEDFFVREIFTIIRKK